MKKFKRYKCVNFDDVPRDMDMMVSVNKHIWGTVTIIGTEEF